MASLNCMRRRHLIAFLMLFSAPRTAYPCSTVVVVSRTGPNFSVIVENDGKPIQGIQVKIGTQYSDITDQSGTVRFRHIPPGSYDVRATNAAGYGSDLAIEVRKASNHQPIEHDQHKLKALTDPHLWFAYAAGTLVTLDRRNIVHSEVYTGGRMDQPNSIWFAERLKDAGLAE